MDTIQDLLNALQQNVDFTKWAKAAALLVIGFLAARVLGRVAKGIASRQMGPAVGMTVRRIVYYGLLLLVAMQALSQLGFNLSIVLGAAGVLTVALGFASQTSASNLVSGLFLVAEKPFELGDSIQIGDVFGEVLAIDLLSVKLRTFDNLYVRVPNETVIKSQITNLTRFDIRRLDLPVGVAYKENLPAVREVLMQTAYEHPLCLDDPAPQVIFQGFGNSSLDLELRVWVKRQNFLDLKTTLPEKIKEAFDRQGIEIPFPHLSLYTGEVTKAFPVRLLADDDPSGGRQA